jgi:hypothetical protein
MANQDPPKQIPSVVRVAGQLYVRRDTLTQQEDALVDRIAYLEKEETATLIRRTNLLAEVKQLERKLKALLPPERKLATKVPILDPGWVVDPEPEDS